MIKKIFKFLLILASGPLLAEFPDKILETLQTIESVGLPSGRVGNYERDYYVYLSDAFYKPGITKENLSKFTKYYFYEDFFEFQPQYFNWAKALLEGVKNFEKIDGANRENFLKYTNLLINKSKPFAHATHFPFIFGYVAFNELIRSDLAEAKEFSQKLKDTGAEKILLDPRLEKIFKRFLNIISKSDNDLFQLYKRIQYLDLLAFIQYTTGTTPSDLKIKPTYSRIANASEPKSPPYKFKTYGDKKYRDIDILRKFLAALNRIKEPVKQIEKHYSGRTCNPSKIENMIAKKQLVEIPRIISASPNFEIAHDFYTDIKIRGRACLFLFETKGGVSIDKFSSIPGEKESIILPGTIMKYDKVEVIDDVKVYKLIDVNPKEIRSKNFLDFITGRKITKP